MAPKDTYTQKIYQDVTESAAGTLTYDQFNLQQWGLGKNDAMLIHRIEYNFSADEQNKIIAESDHIYFGISTANVATTPRGSDPTMLDQNKFGFRISGTPAVDEILNEMWIKDFSNFPGGGILSIPSPLFVWAQGISLATAISISAVVYFTMKTLKPQEFAELVQMMRVLV